MRGEFTVFTVKKSVMIRGCENIDVCGTRIGSQVLALAQRCGCIFGDPKARILGLRRRRKKRFAQPAVLSSEDGTIKDVAQETHLDWKTVKELDKQYMQEQLRRIGTPAPKVIGIDEISIRKGHTYRIVVSDLLRRRAIWFGGQDRSEQSMDQFYKWLGPKKSKQIRLAVMDMWKAFAKPRSSRSMRQGPLFCSISSMFCDTSAMPWTKCAKASTGGLWEKTDASSRARNIRCYLTETI
jgi:hypothetical protein